MTATVITVTSGKGGVGKTTVTANLATALAMQGHKVTAIDSDIGLRNLDVVMGLENRIVYDLVDVIEGRCRLQQAMIKDKRLPELSLIPAAQTRDKMAVSPSDMVLVCDQLREIVDYVLIGQVTDFRRACGTLRRTAAGKGRKGRGDDERVEDGAARAASGGYSLAGKPFSAHYRRSPTG